MSESLIGRPNIFQGLGQYFADAYKAIKALEGNQELTPDQFKAKQLQELGRLAFRSAAERSLYAGLASNALQGHIQNPSRSLLFEVMPDLNPVIAFFNVQDPFAREFLYEILSARCAKISSSPSSQTIEREIARLKGELPANLEEATLAYCMEKFL